MNSDLNVLHKLCLRGREFLGTEYAIMGGAMSWVSECNLVSAISNAGGFGVIACGSMGPDMLREQIYKTFKLTNKPFAVNLIVMHPQIEDLLNVCIECKITHVVLAGGMPKSVHIKSLQKNNIKSIGFAPSLAVAKRIVSLGIDSLIIEGLEAGGHVGAVSTSVLVQEILPYISGVPVFVAGGIATGSMMVNYLMMGAAGCQLGTRFVCATESIAHQNFKKAFIKAQSRDAVVSIRLDDAFPVIPVRAILNKASRAFTKFQRSTIDEYYDGKITKEEAQLSIEKYWAGSLKNAVIDGDIENGSLMAGQCVGMVKKEQTVNEIINEIIEQAVSTITSEREIIS